MERLTERNSTGSGVLKGIKARHLASTLTEDEAVLLITAINKLADYEEAEENGMLIKLPCKVGDTVYRFYERYIDNKRTIVAVKITRIEVYSDWFVISVDGARYTQSEFNKIFFPTREEAEKALKAREGE